MADLRIRKLVPADGAAVAALSQTLGYAVTPREVCERIGAIEDDALAVAYVAVVDGTVAGWIQAHDRRLLQYPRVLEIGGIVVSAEFHGEGVGRHLVEAVGEWGRARGHDQLWVRSNAQRTSAHQFYESIGFEREKTSYTFSRRIG
jgi:GNAT superfamily N-acetyltransferase